MNKNFSLNTLVKGERAKIQSISSMDLPAKFYEMGFIPGASIEIKHIAPFDGPICVHLLASNVLIAIRQAEALHIQVEK